jgi:hypothetical protein
VWAVYAAIDIATSLKIITGHFELQNSSSCIITPITCEAVPYWRVSQRGKKSLTLEVCTLISNT